jgi:hypothetical protein
LCGFYKGFCERRIPRSTRVPFRNFVQRRTFESIGHGSSAGHCCRNLRRGQRGIEHLPLYDSEFSEARREGRESFCFGTASRIAFRWHIKPCNAAKLVTLRDPLGPLKPYPSGRGCRNPAMAPPFTHALTNPTHIGRREINGRLTRSAPWDRDVS